MEAENFHISTDCGPHCGQRNAIGHRLMLLLAMRGDAPLLLSPNEPQPEVMVINHI